MVAIEEEANSSELAQATAGPSPEFLRLLLRGCFGRPSTGSNWHYIQRMRILIIIALFGLLVLSLWFAGTAWQRLGGDPIPLYGWIAIVGGVFFSLLIGGGLMGLVFYSSRHGYDDDVQRSDK